jgi:lysozyme family protein
VKKNFIPALAFVFRWEGGYVDDPRDPGGETKYGISKRSYPDVDIKNLTREKAAEIYKRDYWAKVGGDSLPFPFDVLAFDSAVNCGPGRALKWLGEAKTGHHYLFLRLKHYVRQNAPVYMRGWTNRVIALYEFIEGLKSEGVREA